MQAKLRGLERQSFSTGIFLVIATAAGVTAAATAKRTEIIAFLPPAQLGIMSFVVSLSNQIARVSAYISVIEKRIERLSGNNVDTHPQTFWKHKLIAFESMGAAHNIVFHAAPYPDMKNINRAYNGVWINIGLSFIAEMVVAAYGVWKIPWPKWLGDGRTHAAIITCSIVVFLLLGVSFVWWPMERGIRDTKSGVHDLFSGQVNHETQCVGGTYHT